MKLPPLLPLILLLALVMASPGHGSGQSLQVIRYAENDGLANTLVKSVTTDQKGHIWVGTDGGLFLFDGHEFTTAGDGLPSPYVKSVFCRKNGDVIVSTDLGILVAQANGDGTTLKTLRMGSVRPVDSLLWFPKGCYEDSKGRLWFGDNRKIHCLDRGVLHSYFPGEKAITNHFQRSFSFAEDGDGHLYSFAEPGFVYLFRPETGHFEEVPVPCPLSDVQYALAVDRHAILLATRTGLTELRTDSAGHCKSLAPLKGSPEVSCLFNYAPGRYYAGTWAGGLFDIHREGTEYHITHLDDIGEKNINNIAGGPEGSIWIASDNGLLLLQRNLFASPFKQVTNEYIQCIAGDAQGNTTFCDGRHVFFSPAGDESIPRGAAQILKTSGAMILQAIPAGGGMWFADVNARVWYEKPVGTPVRQFNFSSLGRAVFSLKTDASGNLWACQDQNPALIRITPSFEVRTYGARQGLTSRPLVTALDAHGRVHAGGMADTAYLFAYDARHDRFVNLSKPFRLEHNIDININDMVFDRDGVLWLGSSFGLLRVDRQGVARADLGSMSGSSVKAVAVDQNNNIWLGNSIGLHLFASGELMSFDERTGMSTKIINYRCLHVGRDNRLWVGTMEGVRVSAPLIPPRKTVTPVIFSILVNNEPQVADPAHGLTFNDRSFATLRVGVLDYPYVNFRVEMFLEGRDTVWQPVPRDGHIFLASLEPGNYRLKIRAAKTGNSLTSDSLRFNFTVTRIWYTRGGVLLLMLVIAALLFWLGLHLKTLSLKRYNMKLEEAIRERTHETILQKERIEAQNASILQKNEELRQANTGLEKARIIAEEASDAQRKFLSVMTHELRTPLNAVIGAAHLLLKNNPRPDQHQDLQVLRFSAENLLGLINNILDFTKIESGKVALEKIGFNLRNLVEEIVSAMRIGAREKGIELDYRVGEGIPEQVIGDPLRLSQIINNLVGNALKFTEQGSIHIELILRERTADEALIEFTICDTGIGMTPEIMENLFEIFVQGSSETTRKYGGTGLGLVITQKLLELFGSKIKAESEPGAGTCFSFSIRFPVVSQPAGEMVVDKANYAFTPFGRQRVLLVEDNAVNKMIAMRFLHDWNLAVDSADNGLIALESARHNAYDLILMDIQMPEMDGYEASSAIRAMSDGPNASVPIIALTAAAHSDVSARVFGSGMNDFISKPFNPVELHLKIRKHLG